jgi:NAD(P)-dependent dehydrogenase (short-subunit alcohol dehydrogenase family)
VNAVAPGFIATDMVKKMPEKILQGMRERTPMRRLGGDEINARLQRMMSREKDHLRKIITG